MKDGRGAMAIGFGLLVVAAMITALFPSPGWIWPPVVVALLLGCAVAKGLGG